jgi:hypothetical protein
MRTIAFLLPVLLASCSPMVTQREILIRSKAEVAAREPWADTALLLVEGKPAAQEGWFTWNGSFLTWVVKAGAWDYSEYPSYRGINVVPGTERELRFTRDGCLVSYSDRTGRCPRHGVVTEPVTEVHVVPPAK